MEKKKKKITRNSALKLEEKILKKQGRRKYSIPGWLSIVSLE